ncbi:hypothetical protein VTO42DRAFT_8320 [Malbranchea cinnamomea]
MVGISLQLRSSCLRGLQKAFVTMLMGMRRLLQPQYLGYAWSHHRQQESREQIHTTPERKGWIIAKRVWTDNCLKAGLRAWPTSGMIPGRITQWRKRIPVESAGVDWMLLIHLHIAPPRLPSHSRLQSRPEL